MWKKRLGEIQARQKEIRDMLEGESACDMEAVTAELRSLAEEKDGIERRMAALGELEGAGAAPGSAGTVPNPVADPILGNVMERSGTGGQQGDAEPLGSPEYRNAFMAHVLRGEEIPRQFRANENTKTSDVGALIPTTIMNTIVEKMESVGMILPLVTRTAFKGGVSVPTSSVKPVATWVAEGAGSDKQKKTTGSISFQYFKLRCAVSVSLETDTMALSVFEARLMENIIEGMTKALEQAIISGTGAQQPKGILTETPAAGQAISVEAPSYQALLDAESALPMAYESEAVWCMSKTTFMKFFGLLDSAGQPIGRTNYGIAGKPERFLLGRPVICCDYVPSFSSGAVSGTVFAFLFNFRDFILNTNLEMGIKKYEDNETDDQVTKAIMLTDGKTVDKGSLVTIEVAEAA
jgi:HK97 family phage major capsid protein